MLCVKDKDTLQPHNNAYAYPQTYVEITTLRTIGFDDIATLIEGSDVIFNLAGLAF